MSGSGHIGVLLLSGVRHQEIYARYLAAHPRLRLHALAEERSADGWLRQRSRRLACELGIPYVEDIDLALADPAVDLACIASEPTRHARLACAALRAGKHALIDKPIATTRRDAHALLAAERSSSAKATYVHRLDSPAVKRAKAAVEAGELGTLRLLDIHWTVAGALDEDDDETRLIVEPELSGGGELMNFLGYPVDYARWLTGCEVLSVDATTSNLFGAAHRRHGVEDFGLVTLGLEKGITATVAVGRTATTDHPTGGLCRLIVAGANDTLILDEDEDEGRASSTDVALRRQIASFVDAIVEDELPRSTLADGARALDVILAAYESSSLGRPVAVATN